MKQLKKFSLNKVKIVFEASAFHSKKKILHLSLVISLLLFTVYSCRTDSIPTSDPSKNSINPDRLTTTPFHDGYIVYIKPSAEAYRTVLNKPGKTYDEQYALSKSAAQEFLSRASIQTDKISQIYVTFPGFAASLNPSEAEELKKNPDVEKIVPDQRFNFVKGVMENFENADPLSASSAVNYPGYSDATPQGVTRVGGGTMDATVGNAVWVLDSGCDLSSPELNLDQGRGKSFVPGDLSFNDFFGHGTHVAGIIGAKANNHDLVGVAPNALIVPVRVLDQYGYGAESSILAGLDYIQSMVTTSNTPDIVNISLGFPQRNSSTVLDQKIVAMAEVGIRLVIAAGNSRDDTQYYPMARVSHYNVYVVAAIDGTNDSFANYFPNSYQGSNYGSSITQAEPGVNVLSIGLGNTTRTESGTSMAAPHWAGVLMHPEVSCGCPCGLGPFRMKLDNYKKAADKNDVIGKVGCVRIPYPTYANNVPNNSNYVIGVVTRWAFRPY